MSIKIYNTLSRKKEPFKTLQPGKVSMYVCGPTVYDKAHVGHAMSALVFDIVRRYLEYRGYEVRHVTNYTDVDDKIIQRAAVEGVDAQEIAQRYINEFDQHLKDLNILPASAYPRATEEINRIIEAVADLVEKGYAYPLNGDVYYRVEKFKDYGKLSGRKIEDMEAGFRIDVDDRKDHPMDFALWKAAKPNEPSWPSPWGEGRPGWHIECSVMSQSCLGEQIDIHGGGNDLIFPHHENEIAQSEAMHGKQFASYWMHNGMMQLSGAKMSKSVGNLVTVDSFLEQYEPGILRMMILNSSYRSPLTFNKETIEHAEKALKRLRSALRPALPKDDWKEGPLPEKGGQLKELFLQAMDDDFNTAGTLGHIFDFVKEINQARDEGADETALQKAQSTLLELTGILGLELEIPEVKAGDPGKYIDVILNINNMLKDKEDWETSDFLRDKLSSANIILDDMKQGQMDEVQIDDATIFIDAAISIREKLRENKDWEASDFIRDELYSADIILEDTDQGTAWRLK
ncbi:MAG: cysteine--tRNA ligase [Anaerolineales bacterium]